MTDYQRNIIIQTAVKKMRIAGIRSVSVDDICRDLGMSKKTFYVYFQTKEALIDESLKQLELNIMDEVRKKASGKPILDVLLNAMFLAKNNRDVRQAPPLQYDLKKYYPAIYTRHINRLKAITEDMLARYLKQGVDENLFRKDLNVELTAKLLADLHQVMLDKVSTLQRSDVLSVSKYGLDILIRGILSDEGKTMIVNKLNNKE